MRQHRDLHEGQILIEPVDVEDSAGTNYVEPQECGVQVSLIDFGLSRLTDATTGEVVYTPIPDYIMDGEGRQWDVYRTMRDAADGDWETYRPSTNVLVSCAAWPRSGGRVVR
jgi:serine/threonine protein kinase